MKTTFIVLLIFMLFDILSGLGAAFRLGKFKSSIMREGLWNKAGEVGLLTLATLLDAALPMIGIAYEAHFGALAVACLVVMEIGSICENLAKINPALATVLSKIMDIVNPNDNEDNEKEDPNEI